MNFSKLSTHIRGVWYSFIKENFINGTPDHVSDTESFYLSCLKNFVKTAKESLRSFELTYAHWVNIKI